MIEKESNSGQEETPEVQEEESFEVVSCPEDVIGHLSPEKLETILEEIVTFEVVLVDDPTLPDYGASYLQKVVATCRRFLNRTQYYLQITKRYEKNLKRAAKVYELDTNLKMAGLLADNNIVRNQPAVDDRKAVAMTMLKAEHETMARFQVEVQNLDDTIRLIKSKYDDLRQTNGDIRLQRQLIKDDKDAWGIGENGFTKPTARADKSIPGGMAPAVTSEPIDPSDLLDPNKRPDDLPEPKNASHARLIANFYENKPVKTDPVPEPSETEEVPAAVKSMSYADLLSE